MKKQIKLMRQDPKGRIGMPIVFWLAGVPFGFVVLIWFFFFRGS